MSMNRILGRLVAVCMLTGCASTAVVPAPEATTIEQHILAAARRIENAQAQLNQAGAFGAAAPRGQDAMADGQKVSIAWHGDAEQLLIALAQTRGLAFSTLGQRMPLPVALEAKDETIDNVLARLRAQVGYRASIEQQPGQVILHYNPPRI